jgi:hypothetical protein
LRYRCLMMKMKTWHCSASRGHWGHPLCTHNGH